MSLNPDNIQLGPGDVYLAAYGNGTYSIDPADYTSEGFTTEKGATFSYKGKDLEIPCGNNLATQKIFIIGEEGALEFSQLETSLANIVKSFGYAVSKISANKFTIGDDKTNNYFTVLFETTFDNTLACRLLLYKCQFAREVELNLMPDKPIETPKKINVLNDDAVGDTYGILGQLMFEYTPVP